ncbi:MAG: thiamine-monophosphate kinase, partial [Rhizobiales bacterium]|nr:thiamine-monophosphate kinase [Hyphomicrobiales bacterium]
MQEKDIIAKYFAPLSKNAKGADGLNDDIAVLGNIGSGLLAINMDSLVAGTHFFPNDDPAILAQKCLRVNISDLASKAATPFGYLLSLALPENCDEAFIADFAKGLAIDQRNYGLSLLGGHTVKTAGPLTITITLFGLLQSNKVPRRSHANIDDDIYVSGTIGDGALGLLAHPDYTGHNRLTAAYSRHIGHYLCPEPRVELHAIISQFANASMDISDGLL